MFPLQHYNELPDIKRVIVNTHAIEPQVCILTFYFLVLWGFDFCTKDCLFQSLVEFFGTLSREWALECMKDLLLVNLRGNLQIIVQVSSTLDDNISFVSSISNSYTIKTWCLQTAKEYSEQLGADACIKLFEQFKSYEGLYFFLGSYLSSRYLLLLNDLHLFFI